MLQVYIDRPLFLYTLYLYFVHRGWLVLIVIRSSTSSFGKAEYSESVSPLFKSRNKSSKINLLSTIFKSTGIRHMSEVLKYSSFPNLIN